MSNSNFIVVQRAEQAAQLILPKLDALKGLHRELGDQTYRAMTSVCLNAAEGAAKWSPAGHNHLRIALGSSDEASTALRLIRMQALLPNSTVDEALEKLDEVQAMIFSIMKRIAA